MRRSHHARNHRELGVLGRVLGSAALVLGAFATAWHPGPAEGRARTKPALAGEALPRGRASLDGSIEPGRRPSGGPSPFPAYAAIWHQQRTPTQGPAKVYGRTTSGCLAGAVALPARGEGFIRRRPGRRTGFGHPDLIEYLRRLGDANARSGMGDLVIGDMSLPRGGAFVHGHFSHQTGLDVDIAFKTLRDHVTPPSGAAEHGPVEAQEIRPRDQQRIESLLRMAAADEHVDRIFVGAKIKRLLCRTAVGDRRFLDVLRPWLGHQEHFHVRLKCPVDSPDCRPNEPMLSIPDDCAALSHWWRSPGLPAAYAQWRESESAAYARDLPDACRSLPERGRNAILTTARLELP